MEENKKTNLAHKTQNSGEQVLNDIQKQMNKKRKIAETRYRSISGTHLQCDTTADFSLRDFFRDSSVRTGFFMILAGIAIAAIAYLAAGSTVQMILFILAAVISLNGTNQITTYINSYTASGMPTKTPKAKK